MPTRRHARRRAGFTLVEMMVALTAGAILISSGYILTRSYANFFHRTSRIGTTQSAVRLASEQLRGDIARAGFLAAPDTNGQFECTAMRAAGVTTLGTNGTQLADTVRAVEMDANTAGPATNQVRHDHLTMTGNYVTNERYSMAEGDAAAGVMKLDALDPGFQRSFVTYDPTKSPPYQFKYSAFQAAFQPGRLVRIEVYAPQRRTFFRVIQSVTAGNTSETGSPDAVQVGSGGEPQVNLQTGLPDCVQPANLTNGFIAPVATIDYQVLDPGASGLSLGNLTGGSAVTGTAMEWALVRREYDYANGAFFANSERVVLEYVLEFRLAALWCNAIGVSCDYGNLQLSTSLTDFTTPAQVQGLRVSMAARTPEADPAFDPSGAHDRGGALSGNPLTSWHPADAGVAAARARVRSATFDVSLINNQQ